MMSTTMTMASSSCQMCHILDSNVVLCDGNCGQYWHPSCLGKTTNEGEFFCPNCDDDFNVNGVALASSISRDMPHEHVKHRVYDELQALKQALQHMKADRDQLEERVNLEKEVCAIADEQNAELHR